MKLKENQNLVDDLNKYGQLYKALGKSNIYVSYLNSAIMNEIPVIEDEKISAFIKTLAGYCNAASTSKLQNKDYIKSFKLEYVSSPIDKEKEKSNMEALIANGGKGFSHVGGFDSTKDDISVSR